MRNNNHLGSVKRVKKIFLKPVINQLIKEGYKRHEIQSVLGQAESRPYLQKLIPKLFDGIFYTTLREQSILEMISTILETGISSLTYGKIQSFLPQFGAHEIKRLIKEEWGGIFEAKIQFGREIAIYLFRRGMSDEYILKVLGYSKTTISRDSERVKVFKKLFNGMTAAEAREHFTREYKNVENHIKWYTDLDNY